MKTGFKLVSAIALAAMLVISGARDPSHAQATGVTYVPLGYCQLTSLAAATALSACPGGIPANASRIMLTVEAQAVRYRDDAVNPTISVGMPLAVGQSVPFSSTLSKFRFIEQTSGAKLNVSFYR